MRSRALPLLLAALAAATAAGCGVLEPKLPEAAPGIPAEWPLPATTSPGEAPPVAQADTAAADIGWRDFFVPGAWWPKAVERKGGALRG